MPERERILHHRPDEQITAQPIVQDETLPAETVLTVLNDALRQADGAEAQREPELDDICLIAKEIAGTRGREVLQDPLLLLLKKFFTGDWRKKIGDQGEADELPDELTVAEQRYSIQDLLAIIRVFSEGAEHVDEKIVLLREEIARLSHLDDEETLAVKRASLNQLTDGLSQEVGRQREAVDSATLEMQYQFEIAQEVADFVYTIAKLKNVHPDAVPSQSKIDELLEACGGFTYQSALRFCYFKYGSRLLTGKAKDKEQFILSEQFAVLGEQGFDFNPAAIDIPKVKLKLRELLLEIIGVPERMVAVCDLTLHGKYQGKDVRIVVPRNQNFTDSTADDGDVITYSNFMTSAKVNDAKVLRSVLEALPAGTKQDDESSINGYHIEKAGEVVRIQGIDTTDQARAAEALAQLEIALQENAVINFEVDILREAVSGLASDVTELQPVVAELLGDMKSPAWENYGDVVRDLLITERGLRYVQTVPSINHFKSGRTNQDTHSLLVRGELEVSEETITALIADGVAQYVDSETQVVTAPLLVLEADRKSGLVFDATAKIDELESTFLPQAVTLGPTFGNTGRKLAVTTNSLV